ncbi:MAG: universal stress protein [Byssovorax sp.]
MVSGARVLVATDLSVGADEAIRQGDAWARAAKGELIVCHVVPNALRNNPLFPQRAHAETASLLDAEQAAGQRVQDRVIALTGRSPDAYRLIVDNGAPDATIVAIAERVEATLVVVGSSGHAGIARLLLGSVASRVVAYAHSPVLVARPHARTGRILAATDMSEPALPALVAAADEAKARGAKVTLIHSVDLLPSSAMAIGAPFGGTWLVVPPEQIAAVRASVQATLDDMMKRLAIDGEVRVEQGNPVAEVVNAAEQLDAELVVVGTRGRTGLTRLALGSVADGIVRAAPCSVLVVRLGTDKA